MKKIGPWFIFAAFLLSQHGVTGQEALPKGPTDVPPVDQEELKQLLGTAPVVAPATPASGPDLDLSRASSAAPAASPEPLRDNIFIEMQVVVIPLKMAIPLLNALKEPATVDGAYEKIQGLLEDGTAKLAGWPMITTHSGERAVIEATHELRYPTEFSEGAVEVNLTDINGKRVAQTGGIPELEFSATPHEFQAGHLGVTLEIDPTLSPDGKTIDLRLTPKDERLKGIRKQTIEHEKTHERVSVEQPEFETMTETTSLTVRSGARTLVGNFRISEPPDHLELFILRAEARKP